MFRLNERSINADVAMQMCQRVRNLSTNKIIFVCDGRVKDWDYWPGYICEKIEVRGFPESRAVFRRARPLAHS